MTDVRVRRLPIKRTAVDRPVHCMHAYYLFKVSEARTRPTRVLFTEQHLQDTKLGTRWQLTDGQTVLGQYEVVGIAHFDTGYAVGVIPGQKLAAGLVEWVALCSPAATTRSLCCRPRAAASSATTAGAGSSPPASMNRPYRAAGRSRPIIATTNKRSHDDSD